MQLSFFQFFKRWIKRYWRSLLSLLIGVYLPLQIFALLALQIWQREGGLEWDVWLLNIIHATADHTVDQAAEALTVFGTVVGLAPFVMAIALVLLRQNRWRSLVYLLTTLLGSAIINRVAKTFWHRIRPSLWEAGYPLPHSFSFPSGHAMTSMVFVAVSIILIESRWRGIVLVLGGLYVLLIGWTRLYLGVHYPSDVLAGWMLSIAWATGMDLLIKPSSKSTSLAALNSQESIPE